jgi:hypothetical protein
VNLARAFKLFDEIVAAGLERGGDRYVVSIHAWEPLTEKTRVLHAIIASTL